MVSWIFANIYGAIFKYCIYVLWDVWKTGRTGFKKGVIIRGNKSFTETPSSGGMGSRVAAKRRGFLFIKC